LMVWLSYATYYTFLSNQADIVETQFGDHGNLKSENWKSHRNGKV